jgi:hypothetical protein
MVQQLNKRERAAYRAENDGFRGGHRAMFALDRENQPDWHAREMVVNYRAIDAKEKAAANKRKADYEAARHDGSTP